MVLRDAESPHRSSTQKLYGLRDAISWPRKSARRMRKSWRRLQSFRALKRLGIIDYFPGYPPDALRPQYDDLFGLYLITMRRRPAVILELGGGYSTFVFAHAVRELFLQNHQIAFYSVDESDHWQQRVVKNHLPRELLPFVHFWRSDPELKEMSGELVSTFGSLPLTAANLIYVDGGLVPGNHIGAGALVLECEAPIDYAVLIDNRKRTVDFLKRNLTKAYALGRGPTGSQTLFARARSTHNPLASATAGRAA
jgi:hypothetical protein